MSRSPVPSPKSTPDPIQVGSFFLETLTTGMYQDPFDCIREYVQNGFDAIQDAVDQTTLRAEDAEILITIGGTSRAPSLTIRDNGTGILSDKAYSTLVSLGASRKTPARHAGFRGIGRLAGIAYCTTLRFKTKAAGESVATIVEWDCGRVRSYFSPGAEPVDVREVVGTSVKTRTVPEPEAAHFTEVEMIHLVNLGEEFVDSNKLQPYLRQVCPVDYADNFEHADQVRNLALGYGGKLPVIRVSLQQRRERIAIYKPLKLSYPTSRRNVFSTITHLETFLRKDHGWYGWIGVSNFPGEIVDDTAAGVRFRVKNIQVGNAGIIMALAEQLTQTGSERRLQRWAVGEIFINSTEVVPNARRDGFEDSAAWRAIQRDIKEQVVKRVIKLIRGASSLRSAMNGFASALKRIASALDVPNLTTTANTALETEIRKTLAVLAAADTKYPGADPKEVTLLISRFKELNEKLAKTAILDPLPLESDPDPEPEVELGADHTEETEEQEEDEEPASDPSQQTGGEDEAEQPDVSSQESSGETGPQAPTTSRSSAEHSDLEIVRQVLAEQLGEDEAARLMALIVERLARR
ncbi:MAG: hypothetical protein EOQ45_25505 [Mesorhizobium sp.]|nr:MAG: hypothetical protein EOQ45_25505 [Mesorhizobium sp.]